jgi:hypothetical protein
MEEETTAELDEEGDEKWWPRQGRGVEAVGGTNEEEAAALMGIRSLLEECWRWQFLSHLNSSSQRPISLKWSPI